MLSTKTLLPALAAILGLTGVFLLFLPQELGPVLGLGGGSEVAVQLVAAGMFAIAALNWIGRGTTVGGIYGRPIAIANFAYGMAGGGSLMSSLGRDGGGVAQWALCIVLVFQAVAFARLLFFAPAEPGPGAAPR